MYPPTWKKTVLPSSGNLYKFLVLDMGKEVHDQKSSNSGRLGKTLWIWGRKRGRGAKQKPESPGLLGHLRPRALSACGNTTSTRRHVSTANTRTVLVARFGKAETGDLQAEKREGRGQAGQRVKSGSTDGVTYVRWERLESCPALFGMVHFSHWEIGFLT